MALRSPELGRRGFLVGGTLAVGAAVAACAGPSRPVPGGSSIDTFSAVLKGSGADEGIDPGVSHLFIDEARMKAMYDGLFEVDDTMRPVPRLAETAEPNGDGTRWRIRLRDARWHDGKKLTSADVLYTLTRVLGPPGPRPFIAATTLNPIDLSGCRAVDDRTVEIALNRPYFELPTALAAYGTKIVRDGARDFARAVGTGPFRFESFEAGRALVATANPDYWDGAPKIQRLRILSADTDARVNALLGGQVDFADDLTPSAAKRLREAAGITVHSTPNSGIYYFAMKTDRPPFHQPDVRRALMHLVNRDEMVRVALEGEAEVGNDVFGKGYQYYADLPPHPYDPERARALLRGAGVDALAIDLFAAPAASGFVEAAHLLVDQAAGGGAKVRVVLGSKDTYYSEALRTNALTLGQSGPLPITNHFGSRLLTGSPQNRTKWSDPEFDELYRRAQAAAEEDARAVLYRRMHEIQYDRGGFLFWGTSRWHGAARSALRNIPTGVPNSMNWVRFDKVTG